MSLVSLPRRAAVVSHQGLDWLLQILAYVPSRKPDLFNSFIDSDLIGLAPLLVDFRRRWLAQQSCNLAPMTGRTNSAAGIPRCPCGYVALK